jgi:glycosyltransferase involved in cell wall biosynthesis
VIYHLLAEGEVFSAYRGGAIARNIANMMRFDVSRVVVCRVADDTWGYPPERIVILPKLVPYSKIKGRGHFPAWATSWFFRIAFVPLLSRLKAGDIVWCHNQPAYCAALESLIRKKGVKLVFHAHNSITPYYQRYKYRLFCADAMIFVSEALRQESLRSMPWLKNTHTIHNGADEALFYPLPSGKIQHRDVPCILFVGRLHPTKGVDVLMEAMRILQARKVDAICRIVGSSLAGGSKPTSYTRSLVKHAPSNVQFAPYRPGTEIGQEYQNADIFCCPSTWQEPFGNIVIEAMACGIPVVASRVGGIPEIAAEGGVLLVEPGAAIELADAFQKLIADKELRGKVAEEGLSSFTRRFRWSVICKQYAEIVSGL